LKWQASVIMIQADEDVIWQAGRIIGGDPVRIANARFCRDERYLGAAATVAGRAVAQVWSQGC